MNLIFERGDRSRPVGHALIYFRGDAGQILATYVSVPPIRFDLTKYVPPFMAGAMQGLGQLDAMVAAPMPPIPEEVSGVDYLRALAEQRQDDLVFAGATYSSDPARLTQDAGLAAQQYGELYGAVPADVPAPPPVPTSDPDMERLADMSEGERLRELTALIGRLRDSMRDGLPDPALEGQLSRLVSLLPAKYRGERIVEAARMPGDRGQRLAALYLERSYKLHQEEYLDLQRIDRDIEAIGG